MTKVDAWLVDLDGTLYRARPLKALMAMELAVKGRGAIPVVREFRRQHERARHAPTASAGSSPYQDQIEETGRRLGLDPETVRATVEHWMVARACAHVRRFRRTALLEEIRDFHQAGGRTALVSDYPARAKLLALGAVDLFDTVVASGEPDGPHRLKPDPGGYLLAARRLGVPPERCLVIGDRDDADGAAARRAGMAFRLIR